MANGVLVDDDVARCAVRSARCVGPWERIRGLQCDWCGIEACGRCARRMGRTRLCVDCFREERKRRKEKAMADLRKCPDLYVVLNAHNETWGTPDADRGQAEADLEEAEGYGDDPPYRIVVYRAAEEESGG